jgi:GT2 family glycosyltransferase
MDSQIPLSIIVVSYNTRDLTLEALRSLKAQTKTAYELIVVDNASRDGSAEAIAAEFPEAVMMAETENHGFAKANNLAALRARGDYLLLLNPDTVVLDAAVDRLMTFARQYPEARLWGGKTLFGDMSLNTSNCWRKMSLWNILCRTLGFTRLFPRSGLFNGEAYGNWNRDTEKTVDIITGCFLLTRRSTWEQLGGFDLRYVMYGEEADLCLRARKLLGAQPMVTSAAQIIHYGGASETIRTDKMVRLLKAKATLILRHFPSWQRPLGLALFAGWPASRALLVWLLARLGRGKGHSAWIDVWRRRAEWQKGYPALDA